MTRVLILISTVGLLAGLAGCGLFAGIDCQSPLTQGQCDSAVSQARAAVQDAAAKDHWPWPGESRASIIYTVVWSACSQASCLDDLGGRAFVRLVDKDTGTSLGAAVVCVDDAICSGEAPSFYLE